MDWDTVFFFAKLRADHSHKILADPGYPHADNIWRVSRAQTRALLEMCSRLPSRAYAHGCVEGAIHSSIHLADALPPPLAGEKLGIAIERMESRGFSSLWYACDVPTRLSVPCLTYYYHDRLNFALSSWAQYRRVHALGSDVSTIEAFAPHCAAHGTSCIFALSHVAVAPSVSDWIQQKNHANGTWRDLPTWCALFVRPWPKRQLNRNERSQWLACIDGAMDIAIKHVLADATAVLVGDPFKLATCLCAPLLQVDWILDDEFLQESNSLCVETAMALTKPLKTVLDYTGSTSAPWFTESA